MLFLLVFKNLAGFDRCNIAISMFFSLDVDLALPVLNPVLDPKLHRYIDRLSTIHEIREVVVTSDQWLS